MNPEIKSLDIYSDNYQFESDYFPLISLKNQDQKDAMEKYIFRKAEIFFEKIIQINTSTLEVRRSYISYSKMITDIDFKKKKIKYFYENLFDDLMQRDSNNKLKFHPKWGITFDENCCPILTNYLSPKYIPNNIRSKKSISYQPLVYRDYGYPFTFQRYGTFDINGEPVFYYIYFTLQELLDEIKRLS